MAKPRNLDALEPLHRLWFLVLAQADLAQCAKAARIALAQLKTDQGVDARFTFDTLAECAVIRYARPFGRCILPQRRLAGHKRPAQLSTSLPVSFVERTGLPGAMSVHEAAMRLRDQVYAHSDAQEKGMRLTVVERDGMPMLQSAAAIKPVSPDNLVLLERLARTLASNLTPEIWFDAHRVLPQLHPGKPPDIGQSFTFGFERGAE